MCSTIASIEKKIASIEKKKEKKIASIDFRKQHNKNWSKFKYRKIHDDPEICNKLIKWVMLSEKIILFSNSYDFTKWKVLKE